MSRHWSAGLRPPREHFKYLDPEEEWEKRDRVCGWCGSAPKAEDEDRCIACLEQKAEKEAETMPYNPVTAMGRLDPRVARIISGGSIVEPPTDAREVGREPTSVPLSGVGSSLSRDLASIANHCQEIELILARMKKETAP